CDGSRRPFSGEAEDIAGAIRTFEAIGVHELIFDCRGQSIAESIERLQWFHPRLERPERMLDRLAPLAHFFRVLVEPALDGFENMLMLPARDPSFLAGGAAVLDGAALAGIGPVAAQDQPVFLVRVVIGECFTS